MRLRYAITVLACMVIGMQAAALDVSRRYRSPRNPERKVRSSTQLIVLHTTEAPARSSLNKLCDRGEAHYCVTESGEIYAIVDRDREAFHAGRSMWNGQEDVDKFSIGIECVGYHNKPMPYVQLVAIRNLVKELQRMYGIPDARVVCHSHVAYGSPNKWQKRRHRGRKRCGMLFAMPSVRRTLQLSTRPACDVDTRAGRLAIGDPYLQKVLYGSIDTMAGARAAPAASGNGSWFGRFFGGSSSAAAKSAAEPKPATAKPATAKPAKPATVKTTTVKPAKTVAARSGGAVPKSVAQLKSGGWVLKGCVSLRNPASKIAGGRWKAADTYYTIRDRVIPGNKIDESRIEKGMGVWMKR